MQTKFVVVIGSLMSGLGKGVVTSSILKILDFYSFNVFPAKFDGYLNYDCGTMNPYRHGEVFVLDDKSELDMDFGMYERFLEKDLNGDLSITGGKVFGLVTAKERRGDYLGEDVQIIPHLTNEIISKIENIAEKNKLDVLVIEVGGTAGDIENNYFIEAMRQLSLKRDVVFVNLTYVPEMGPSGEQKTKPTQLAFRTLMQLGIKPDLLVCRSQKKLEQNVKKKLAMFTSLNIENIIDDQNTNSIYELPLNLIDQNFDKLLLGKLGFPKRKLNTKKLAKYKAKVSKILHPKGRINIAIVGKYTELQDSYASVKEAITHACAQIDVGANLSWINSEQINEKNTETMLGGMDGIIIPGGFGVRGIEGMVTTTKYARENKVPLLGICLGMQIMAIEFARNVCMLKGANSSEFDKNARYKIVDIMPSQKSVKEKGGTMRLGAWKCRITSKNTTAYKAYRSMLVSERHRHRYEINNRYRKLMSKRGLVVSGTTTDGKLVEMIEWKNGNGIGTQAHPELKSRLNKPAPLFANLINQAYARSKKS